MLQSQSQSQSSTIPSPGWFSSYASQAGKYDELIDEHGNIRPHWNGVIDKLGNISVQSWNRRKSQLDKLIHEYGMTYNLYGIDDTDSNVWTMDMMPNCLPESEFKKIESQLSQRAFLLNLILKDVYGTQGLLKNGKIDPYLIYANPQYLRPCHGIQNSSQRYINVYAADLVRNTDGSWSVLSDRIESAGGLGYSLENRALMSRVFPAVMAEAGVQSLVPFTKNFSNYLSSLAPSYIDNPNVALLSSGPSHETYFEQSFLSRNLGFSLVEGADLMVRNNRLYMKTIKGVKAVDVLLRRVQSSMCDPLELNNNSLIGVPGLVNVVRSGNLIVANALGSGFAETPALPSMLPWFARNYLGENLEMQSVNSWWCGIKENLDYVISNIEASIQSTLPKVSNMTPDHTPYTMRVIMIPSNNGWELMLGGLIRYSEEGDLNISVSMKKGAGSKDVWVIGDSNKQIDSNKKESEETQISPENLQDQRSYYQEDLPSRAADNLFWLGRYLERSEALARVIKTVSNILIRQSGQTSIKTAQAFIHELSTPPEKEFALSADGIELPTLEEIEKIILYSIYDKNSGVSLFSNFANVERIASIVKERLSADNWHRLLSMCNITKTSSLEQHAFYDDDVILTLETAVENLTGFTGSLVENMTRSYGWYFLQIGRRLERAIGICRLLKSLFLNDHITSESTLEYLLEWADNSITYRRIYTNKLNATNVIDLICFDDTNPRSLAYQALDIKNLFAKLPHDQTKRKHPLSLTALSFYSRISLLQSSQLLEYYHQDEKEKVAAFFDQIKDDILLLANEIEQTYFAHSKTHITSALADLF